MAEPFPFELPVVVLPHVFAHLEDVHVAVLRLVCKEWRREAERVMVHPTNIPIFRRREDPAMSELMLHVGANSLAVLFNPPPKIEINRCGTVTHTIYVTVNLPALAPNRVRAHTNFVADAAPAPEPELPRAKPRRQRNDPKKAVQKAERKAQQRALKRQFKRR